MAVTPRRAFETLFGDLKSKYAYIIACREALAYKISAGTMTSDSKQLVIYA